MNRIPMKAASLAAVSQSFWWKAGALSGASAIISGAFGSHALKTYVPDAKLQEVWKTAAHYHLIHSAVLLAVPFAKRPGIAGSLIVAGTSLFSGSLYAMVLCNGQKKLGILTPIGGATLVVGWLALLL